MTCWLGVGADWLVVMQLAWCQLICVVKWVVVVVSADVGVKSLMKVKPLCGAETGKKGRGKHCHGSNADDTIVHASAFNDCQRYWCWWCCMSHGSQASVRPVCAVRKNTSDYWIVTYNNFWHCCRDRKVQTCDVAHLQLQLCSYSTVISFHLQPPPHRHILSS